MHGSLEFALEGLEAMYILAWSLRYQSTEQSQIDKGYNSVCTVYPK